MKKLRLALSSLLLLAVAAAPCIASGPARLSRGATVYVSVYSNVFTGPKARPLSLSTILSIRNTDTRSAITVTGIDYYDTGGKLLRRHVTSPLRLGPLGTTYIHLGEEETEGGPGANFIVKWQAAKPVNAPIIESVMLGTRGGQGISFVTPGQEIRE